MMAACKAEFIQNWWFKKGISKSKIRQFIVRQDW
ncbi:MAG: hypothetical protein sGL2_06630 [Candidatus Mesenet longicola]|nr:MAG: hypothetical protein sGL2_06630 [Candidatus Mesenet longicola]